MLEVEVKFKKDGTVRRLRAVDREAVEEALAARGLTPDDVSLRTLRDSDKLRAEAAQLGATADSLAKANSPSGESLRFGFDGVKPVVRSGSVKKLAQGWLVDIFPTALEKGSDYSPLDALLDMGGYPLRSAGALFDAANPYSTRTAENRYGVREGLEDSQKDRWSIDVPLLGQVSPGAMLHGTLHDQMTVPMAIPGAGVSRMIGPGRALLGKVARGSLSGGVTGAMTEAARPAFTDTELDGDYLKNIMLGLGSGAALGVASPIAGRAVSGLGSRLEASIPRTRVKLANISNVNPEALEVASTDFGMEQLRKNYGAQADLAAGARSLYDKFNIDENMPEAAGFINNLRSIDRMMDVYPVGREGRNIRKSVLRENESKTLPPGLEAAVARIEKNAEFFDPRYEYQPYYGEPGASSADASGLSDIMLGNLLDKPLGTDLQGYEFGGDFIDPAKTKVIPYEWPQAGETKPRRTPKEFRSLYAIQKNKQSIQDLIGNKYSKVSEGRTKLEDGVYERQARALRKTLLQGLQEEGTPQALEAIDQLKTMAAKNQALQTFRKRLSLGTDVDNFELNSERAFKNMFKEDTPRTRRMKESAKQIDNLYGTDFYGRGRYASLADNISQSGGESFELSTTNKWPTGRSTMLSSRIPLLGPIFDPYIQSALGYTPKGAVRRLRGTQALAEGLRNLGELGPTGIAMRDLSLLTNGGPKTPSLSEFMQNSGSPYYSPFYERPASQPASNERAEKKKEKEVKLAKVISMLVNGGAQAVGLEGPTYKANSVADLR